ncbi:DUF4138 domain-containing protein [Tamlana sp. I1]|uniref:DUF4138 domain-containing protein n=1 Tax=Tamlana sp. I1 TaxID=2762061 RepID=UPI00188E679A|nr:DUF4138 domain-containing protein [Tamlana sp. I1]
MKVYVFVAMILLSCDLIGQKRLDTIYANNHKNVALFFTEPIRQGVTGAPHFVFTYNRDKEQYFGLLQATPGKESNLISITKNGQVYSYILKYKEHITKLNYFIGLDESIGTESPVIIDKKTDDSISSTITNKSKDYKNFCDFLLSRNTTAIKTKKRKGVKVQLQDVAYHKDEVYLVIEIKNKSHIDFEVDYLNVYITSGNKRRKASFQRLQQNIMYHQTIPNQIKANEGKRFVCVLPKFVLGDNERLMVELSELNGGRKVLVKTNKSY